MSERYRRPDFRRPRGYNDRHRTISSGSRQTHRAGDSRSRDRRINEPRRSETGGQYTPRANTTSGSPRSHHGHSDSSRRHSHERSDRKEEHKREFSKDKTSAREHKARDERNDTKSERQTIKNSANHSKSRKENTRAGTSDTRSRDKYVDTKTERKTDKSVNEIKPKIEKQIVRKSSSAKRSENIASDKEKFLNVTKDTPAKDQRKGDTTLTSKKTESHGSQSHNVRKSKEKKTNERNMASHRSERPEKSIPVNTLRETSHKRSEMESKQTSRNYPRARIQGCGGFSNRALQRPFGNRNIRTFGGRNTRTLTRRSATNRRFEQSETNRGRSGERREPGFINHAEQQERYHEENDLRDRFSKPLNEFHGKDRGETEVFDSRFYDERERHNESFDKQRLSHRVDINHRQESSFHRELRQEGSFDRERKQEGSYDRERRREGSYDREKRQECSYDRERRQDASYDRAQRPDAMYDREQHQGANYDREHRHDADYDKNRWSSSYAEPSTSREDKPEYRVPQDYYETSLKFDGRHENRDRSYDRSRHEHDGQFELARTGLDSDRHLDERDNAIEQDYNRRYDETGYERSSDLRGRGDVDFQASERHEYELNRNDHGLNNESRQEQKGNFRQWQTGYSARRSVNVKSRSQQHYRNTKRKLLTSRFHTLNRNKYNDKYHKRPLAAHKSEGESKMKSEGTRHERKQTDRPKANPQVDRGASGCLLKEDRPYKERQNEGFVVHMDPPLKQNMKRENETEGIDIDTVQQPMIIIPNQDGRQTLDQFGNIINLPDVGQGGLAPIPIQNSNGQEMLFIPFGGNTVLPENIVPVQQAGFPVGFVPQLIPSDQLQRNVTASENDFDENEIDTNAKNENTKHSTKKTLTSEQRAKIRTKLKMRRKENLVKEVEKKVLENLDKKSIDGTLKSSTQEKGAKSGTPKKITKKDAKGQNIYEDVSDLDDVSDLEDVSDEEVEENLSDWEKVSVDEIELDANERRPKFRKQNEPRTLIQHSITRRKLNVRRGPVHTLIQSNIENNKGTEQTRRNDKLKYRQAQLLSDIATVSNPVRIDAREKVISSKIQTGMHSDHIKMEHEKSTTADKRVFKAYTAKRISEELKRIEIENRMKSLQEQRTLTVKDRKSNVDDYKRSNIREQRPISPLQVTVRNNLYEKKENVREYHSDGANEFDESDHNRRDGGQFDKAEKYDSKHDRNLPRQKLSGNRGFSTDNRMGEEITIENNTHTDKRIIREKTLSGHSNVNIIRKGDFPVSGKQNNNNEVESGFSQKNDRHDLNKKNTWRQDSGRNEDRSRKVPFNERDTGNKFDQKKDKSIHSVNRNERNRNSSGKDECNQRSETIRKNSKEHREPPPRYRGDRKTPPRYRENRSREAERAEQYSKKTESWSHQKQRYDRRDDRGPARSDYDEQERKRDFRKTDDEDLREGISSVKKMRNVENENDFGKKFNRKDHSLESKVETLVDMNNATVAEQQGNRGENFDPSLPPVQTMPAMTAPPAPPLPDMSLPPPQLMRTQYVPSSQVVIQTPPLLGQPTQIQNVQQPQIIGLQQSQPIQTLQNTPNLQQQTLSFQPQSVGMQHSFQQQALSQQSNLGILQQQSSNQPIQFQNSDLSQQTQQRSYQIVIDHSQPLIHQLGQQQNVSSQQPQQMQPQIIHTNVQQSQTGSVSSQLQNLNQLSGSVGNQQRQQGQIVTNQNPFQNVQQTLNTLGITQGAGMQARIVSVGQGQNIIQGQVGGQTQQRGYLVPTSFSGNPQG